MLHYLYNRVIMEGGDEAHSDLIAEINLRSMYDTVFSESFPGLAEEELVYDLKDYDCYRFMIDSFEAHCGKANDYGRKYFKYLRHVCVVGDAELIGDTAQKIADSCKSFQ